MDNIKYRDAMAEVLEVMKGLEQKDIDKIPKKLIEYFKTNCSPNYVCKFDYHKPIKDLELNDETIALLDMLCINYWCENELQKQKFLGQLTENEQKYQKELEEKFNSDNIFKNRQLKILESRTEILPMVKYKESIFTKIKNWIKSFFEK